MDTPEHFTLADGHACYRPVGQVTLQEGINLVSIAITYARQQSIPRLLVDTTGLTGIDPPTTLERFVLGGQFARAAQGEVKTAFVARQDLIDPKKFGLTVARNRGMIAEVFTDLNEAIAWLLDGGVK